MSFNKNAAKLAAGAYLQGYECMMQKDREIREYYHDRTSIYMFPSVIMVALSCEVAIKSKLASDTYGHNLKKLFTQLPPKSQLYYTDRTISLYNQSLERFNRAPSFTSDNFNDSLEKNSTVFIDYRYFYEKSNYADLDFLETFAFSLNDLSAEDYMVFLNSRIASQDITQ